MVLRDSCARVLTALLAACAMLSACCPDLPDGTTAEDVAKADISQGVYGKAFTRTGECSKCGLSGCSVENITADFLFVPAAVDLPVRTDAGECFVQLGSRRQGYLGRPVTPSLPDTTSVSLASGTFAAQLDAGSYWVVIQKDGCGVCYGNTEITGTDCSQITVQENTIVTHDIIVDVSY